MNWRALLWWRPPCILARVLVNTIDEDTVIEGVLWSSRGAWLTFRDARLLRPGAEPAPIDGAAVIHRDKVLFLQVLP